MAAPQQTVSPQHHNLNVRLPADLVDRLREMALRERNGLSAVVRRILATSVFDAQASARAGGRG